MPTYSSVGHALQFGDNTPTVSIVGTDTDGYIIYDMSTSGTFYEFDPNVKHFALQVIFGAPFLIPPGVTLSPANSNTAGAVTADPSLEFFVDQADVTTAYFKISGISTSTPLLGPEVLVWSYAVGGVQAGAGSGTVTSVDTTTRLTGGPIITTGTLDLAVSGISAGTYQGIVFDAYGRATSASNQSYGHVSSVATTSRLTGGPITTTGTLDLAVSGVSATTKNGLTFDAYGRITATPSGHLVADGYTIDLSAGATSNQVIQYNGSNFVASTIASQKFQAVYNAGANNTDELITFDSTRLGITFSDNGVAISSSLFNVWNNGGSIKYLTVNGTGASVSFPGIQVYQHINSWNGNTLFIGDDTGSTTAVQLGVSATPINIPGILNMTSTGSTGCIDFTTAPSAAVSASSHGRIRYNAGTQHFEISENAGSFGAVARLDVAQTYTKSQNVASFGLSDSATISTDASQGNVFTVTIGATGRTLANPTNLTNGGTYLWIIRQDSGGAKTITTYGNLFKFPGGTAPTLSTGGNAVDMISAVYDGSQLNCVFQADFR
jgi:hypothetical protein